MGNTPTREGFFWGRWHTPAPGTTGGDDATPGTIWEVHSVWFVDHSMPLLVFVPGFEKPQPMDAFEWGEEVPRPSYARSTRSPNPRPHGAAGQPEEN